MAREGACCPNLGNYPAAFLGDIMIKVHLFSQSKPIEYTKAINSYTKDGMYCLLFIKEEEGKIVKLVHKFPLCNIFRVEEEYNF